MLIQSFEEKRCRNLDGQHAIADLSWNEDAGILLVVQFNTHIVCSQLVDGIGHGKVSL